MAKAPFTFNLKDRNKLIYKDIFPTVEELNRTEKEYQRNLREIDLNKLKAMFSHFRENGVK